jgi:UDP-N-acetylglucosamine 4-epimerase
MDYHKRDLSNINVLVTGGAGFIGSNIVEYLLKFGVGKVRVVDNLLTGFYDNLREFEDLSNFEFIKGDLTDKEVCKHVCEDIHCITHQAALGSVPRSINDPIATNHNNVTGFINIITAAKDSGVKRFVYASSSSVYGDEPTLPKVEDKTGNLLSPYAVSKHTNEIYAKVFNQLYDFEVIGMRYFNVFGPKQSPEGAYAAVIPLFVDGLMNGKDVFIDGKGDQTRDFTFVENAVQANIKALFSAKASAFGEVFNIACGERISVLDLYENISNSLGVNSNPIFREPRKGDIKNSLADITKAKELLGYEPFFTVAEGLDITVKTFKALGVN